MGRIIDWISEIKKQIYEQKFLILFIVVSFWTLPLSTFLPGSGLDPSWTIGINLAYLNNLSFGTGIEFTYGVLGFLGNPLILDYHMWLLSFTFSVFTHFLFVFSIYLLLKKISARWYHYIIFIPVFLFAFPVISSSWFLLVSLSIFLFLILIQNEISKGNYYYLAAIGFLLAVVSLIKFDMLWNSLYLLLGFCCINFIQKRDIRQIITLLISYTLSFFMLWLISRQALPDIVAYVIGGYELTKGYSEAMAFIGPFWQVCLGIISLLFLLVVGIYLFISKRKEALIFFVLNGIILFSAFKSGFVRQDGHILEFLGIFIIFFGILLVFLTIGSLENTKKTLIFSILTIVFIGLFIVSIHLVLPHTLQSNIVTNNAHAGTLFSLMVNQNLFNQTVFIQKEKIQQDYSLNTSILENISNYSVDILPWDIALCWAYDLNWTPRPVFQSYTAYTPYLDNLNSQHFIDGTRAPERILYSYNSIDGRYPLFDEPETFRTILEHYSYVGRSGSFILLSRTPYTSGDREVKLGSATFRMGEPVKVPAYDGEIFGNISVHYSIWGNIEKTLFKPDPLYIRFISKTGLISKKYRFIPDTASDGLLLSQYVSNTDIFTRIFQGHMINDIQSIIIETDHPEEYSNDIGITFIGKPINSTK